jgi:hypothetical protein
MKLFIAKTYVPMCIYVYMCNKWEKYARNNAYNCFWEVEKLKTESFSISIFRIFPINMTSDLYSCTTCFFGKCHIALEKNITGK